MTTIILYGIPNCDTVKKARTWLDTHGIVYQFHNFKKDGVDIDAIATWLTQHDIKTLINQKGTTWRGLDQDLRDSIIDNATAIKLMNNTPSVIKRPVLSIQTKKSAQTYFGFSDAQYQQIFSST